MPRIVEKFVRKFYDREQDRFSVGRHRLEQRAVIERPVGEPVEGMLLYPVVERTLDLEYEVDGRRVRVCTVDWRRELRGIRRRLLGVL